MPRLGRLGTIPTMKESHRTPQGQLVPASAVTVEVTRSGGPGGQHANTSNTAVRVVIDLDELPLSAAERARSTRKTVQATSSRHRSQARNRQEALQTALERLDGLLARKPRRTATAPTTASRIRRLESKRRQSERKTGRRTGKHDEN